MKKLKSHLIKFLCIQYGVTRIVISRGAYVIKIPNFRYSHQNFLAGSKANWDERTIYKLFRDLPEGAFLVPTVYCSLFGLISIQKKARILERSEFEQIKRDRNLYKNLKKICSDFHSKNFGEYDNRIVCVDYA